jgi:hypothetical protein
LLQNGKFNSAIKKHCCTIHHYGDLIYKYDTETQYWAGNEFLYFENKDIRAANNNISRVGASEIYNCIYIRIMRVAIPIPSQDINGNFVVQNFNVSDSSIEADYAWVYFSLLPLFNNDHEIYINGMFNNYSLT